MLTFLIPLIIRPDGSLSIHSVVFTFDNWKIFDRKAISFPEGEEPEYVKLVRQTILRQLAYLEEFFSKKASTEIPESRPGYDIILELKKDVIKTKTPYYQTPI
jgi:hypothetical protein